MWRDEIAAVRNRYRKGGALTPALLAVSGCARRNTSPHPRPLPCRGVGAAAPATPRRRATPPPLTCAGSVAGDLATPSSISTPPPPSRTRPARLLPPTRALPTPRAPRPPRAPHLAPAPRPGRMHAGCSCFIGAEDDNCIAPGVCDCTGTNRTGPNCQDYSEWGRRIPPYLPNPAMSHVLAPTAASSRL